MSPVAQVVLTAERVVNGAAARVERDGVDGEVAPRQVVQQAAAEGHLGFARARLVGLGAIGRDLHLQVVEDAADGAEFLADLEHVAVGRAERALGLPRRGAGGEVEVVPEGAPSSRSRTRPPTRNSSASVARAQTPRPRRALSAGRQWVGRSGAVKGRHGIGTTRSLTSLSLQ